jgi:hypothetical protein
MPIPDSFAVLSADGTILFVNEHWKSFALQNSGSSVCAGAGGNYLEVCRKAAADGAVEAGQFLEAFQTLVEKQSASFALESPCHSPVEKRWFRVRVHKTEEAEETLYLVVHENITERKRQLELQEKNNAFFETITTGARVGILIAGFDGRVIEYNSGRAGNAWLQRRRKLRLAQHHAAGISAPGRTGGRTDSRKRVRLACL